MAALKDEVATVRSGLENLRTKTVSKMDTILKVLRNAPARCHLRPQNPVPFPEHDSGAGTGPLVFYAMPPSEHCCSSEAT
jgi:hypothetical protein